MQNVLFVCVCVHLRYIYIQRLHKQFSQFECDSARTPLPKCISAESQSAKMSNELLSNTKYGTIVGVIIITLGRSRIFLFNMFWDRFQSLRDNLKFI